MSPSASGSSEQPGAASYHMYAQSEAKRRRLRKGTHSCWECKRRKMRCIFDPVVDANSITNTIISPCCNGCRRRGTQCVSQEFPEDVSFPSDDSLTRQSPIAGSASHARFPNPLLDQDANLPNQTKPSPPLDVECRRSDYNNSIPNTGTLTTKPSGHLSFHTTSKVRTSCPTMAWLTKSILSV